MRFIRLLAGSLRNRFVVRVARLFSFSAPGIGLLKVLLLPVEFIRCMRLWPRVVRYGKILLPKDSALKCLLRYHMAQADQAVWSALVHNQWDHVLKYNDFTSAAELRDIAGRGRGMLLLGMHYGVLLGGYLLYREGLNPAILAARINIPSINLTPFKKLLTNEYVFRGTYDGIIDAVGGEKRFLELMLAGRPGFIMMDGIAETNFLFTNCLGVDYPIGIFPFKLALKRGFPVVTIWFSKIEGQGYKLNVREMKFGTVEEGIARYGDLLDEIVRADPFRWYYGPAYADHYERTRGESCNN